MFCVREMWMVHYLLLLLLPFVASTSKDVDLDSSLREGRGYVVLRTTVVSTYTSTTTSSAVSICADSNYACGFTKRRRRRDVKHIQNEDPEVQKSIERLRKSVGNEMNVKPLVFKTTARQANKLDDVETQETEIDRFETKIPPTQKDGRFFKMFMTVTQTTTTTTTATTVIGTVTVTGTSSQCPGQSINQFISVCG